MRHVIYAMIVFQFGETFTESLSVMKRPSFPDWERLFVRTERWASLQPTLVLKSRSPQKNYVRLVIQSRPYCLISPFQNPFAQYHFVTLLFWNLQSPTRHFFFFNTAPDSGAGAAGSPSCPWHIEPGGKQQSHCDAFLAWESRIGRTYCPDFLFPSSS